MNNVVELLKNELLLMGMSKEAIQESIETQISELSGLIDEEGALRLIKKQGDQQALLSNTQVNELAAIADVDLDADVIDIIYRFQKDKCHFNNDHVYYLLKLIKEELLSRKVEVNKLEILL